ncbi:MAG: cysteine desulfurase [Lachnospiraceae bacterium]|nr:cysteine desulfurase [Lachnospiraceae bacterium]
MEAYLDNSATTRVTASVRDVVVRTMTEDFGNPSSKHRKGLEAERYLRDARENIAKTLKVNEKEIFFTSGGTESDNWAILGAAAANRRAGMHIITSAVEHAAVLMPVHALEEQGYRVTVLPVDAHGRIRLEELEAALCEDTILVSIMAVNNEVGTIQPIAEAGALIKKKCPQAVFHVDAVQAYGKYRIYPKRQGIDLLSVSGHKLHGPKGSGFLYVREGVRLQPLILGGGQQKGMRSGTDNVPGAAGLAQAAVDAFASLDIDHERMLILKARLMDGLSLLPDVVIHSQEGEQSAAHIVSAAFVGVRSEVLLHALEERGIYVSAGSACSSNKKLPVSPVLKEMHLPKEQLESTLRFSFCRFTTEEEIDYTLEALRELLPVLRRFTRR